MLFNYLRIAFRKLFKSGSDRSQIYSWINLSGLTIGLTAFLLISHYVNYELSYDRFYPNHKNKYRIAVERIESGEVTMNSAKTYAGLGNILTSEISEVNQYVRMLYEECQFTYEPEDIRFNRQTTLWADGNFHEFFGLDILINGQLELLNQPNHAIISRTAAERIFGLEWYEDNEPIGKTILLNGGVPFMIQGVFEDIPANSHMKVDFVVSYSTLMALLGDFMNTVMPPNRNFVYTYIELQEGSNKKSLEDLVMNDIIASHTGELDAHVNYNFTLQPISNIHLDSHLSDELQPNSNRIFIIALSIAALLIVIVAWINFISLTIARAMNRAKEVGVRKAMGARKRQIAIQFTVETLFSGFLAIFLTMILSLIGGWLFDQSSGITIPLYSFKNWFLWLVFLVSFLGGALLASIYPALLLSAINPVKALKGKNATSMGSGYFRQGLIMFQFLVALLLITCTGAIYYQVDSMRKQSLGIDLNQVIVVHSPRTMIGNPDRAIHFRRFRDSLEPDADIISVASGANVPGDKFLDHIEDVQAEGIEMDINWSFDMASVDDRYLPTLGMELIDGRNFEDRRVDEENKVILNEKAVEALGFKDPFSAIGKFIRIERDRRMQIIGVMENAHFEGLREPIKPVLLSYGHNYEFGFYPIKTSTNNLSAVIRKIEDGYATNYPKDPFEYFFLDSFFNDQYQKDQAFGQLFGTFSLLTIFIAGLGLFGLISFTTYQRSKEIGIRKVLGASVMSIINLLTINFLKLMILAAIIALPLSYWIIDRWLDTFAYRFELSIGMYIVPVILLMITSMVAVGSQTLKSALSNPVDSIADE